VELGFLTEEVESRPGDAQLDSQQLPDQAPQTSAKAVVEQARSDQRQISAFLDRLQKIINQLEAIVARLQDASHRNHTLKDQLRDAYMKLLIVSEARLNWAGTVEALRRFNLEGSYKRLPIDKADLENAERAFDEADVYRILVLLDNNKVWFHYYLATEAFRQYMKRTSSLVEEALQPRSPVSYIIPRWHVFLNPKLDDDPSTRKIYESMYNEMNAMRKAMNKRLRF
jgi:hypothetical protein